MSPFIRCPLRHGLLIDRPPGVILPRQLIFNQKLHRIRRTQQLLLRLIEQRLGAPIRILRQKIFHRKQTEIQIMINRLHGRWE